MTLLDLRIANTLIVEERKVTNEMRTRAAAAIVTVFLVAGCSTTSAQRTFATPDDAVNTAVTVARADNNRELEAIFGPGSGDIISSGDPVIDKERRNRFLQAYDEKHALIPQDDRVTLVVGNQDWPFPIPLVRKGKAWLFDTPAGRDEILNRRIGEDELYTIQACLAIVDAQREYAERSHDRSGVLAYARKFISDPGAEDGLYWPAKPDEPQSPLGSLAAEAQNQGYKGRMRTGQPQPFHGYYYIMLTAQGPNASGGAYDYVVNGRMIGGFAVVAYPAEYGNSGVMTFMVSNDGNVYQKDLGPDTARLATAITAYDPDRTWTRVQGANL